MEDVFLRKIPKELLKEFNANERKLEIFIGVFSKKYYEYKLSWNYDRQRKCFLEIVIDYSDAYSKNFIEYLLSMNINYNIEEIYNNLLKILSLPRENVSEIDDLYIRYLDCNNREVAKLVMKKGKILEYAVIQNDYIWHIDIYGGWEFFPVNIFKDPKIKYSEGEYTITTREINEILLDIPNIEKHISILQAQIFGKI